MKLKKGNVEKENLDKESNADQSIWHKTWLLLRHNWLSLTCALIICVITIVAVPIIYSIDKGKKEGGITVLSWNVTGHTLINGNTSLNGQMDSLGNITSLVFDSNNNLFLVDSTRHRIVQFDLISSSLKLVFGKANGTSGSDLSSLNTPRDLAFNQTEIFIADSLNHRILRLAADGTTASLVFGNGSAGNAVDRLDTPTSVAIHGSQLFIADYRNHRIVLLNLQTPQTQHFLANSTGLARNRYVYTPISIRYHTPTSTLVIGQELGFNVIRWSPGSSEWTLIAGSASSQLNGTSRTLFSRVCSINVNNPNPTEPINDENKDNTYIADCDNQRIQFFQGDGKKGRTIAGVIQASGNSEYLFSQPSALAFDKDMNLFVADSNNSRIQKFLRI